MLVQRYLLTRQCFLHSCRWRGLSNISIPEKPTLYGDIASPPVRFALMTAAHLNVDLKFHKIDLFKAENRANFFSKINPLQKVPALAIGEEVIRDSNAISLYLCNTSKNKDLYPDDDALMKAKINEMMFFNADVLFPLDREIFSAYFAGKLPVDEEKLKQWYSMLDYLNNILMKHQWIAGEKMTLGDICCVATVSSLSILHPLLERHGKVKDWIKNLQELPYYSINNEGLQRLKGFVEIISKHVKP